MSVSLRLSWHQKGEQPAAGGAGVLNRLLLQRCLMPVGDNSAVRGNSGCRLTQESFRIGDTRLNPGEGSMSPWLGQGPGVGLVSQA